MAETDFDIDAAADKFDAGKDLDAEGKPTGKAADADDGGGDDPPGFKSYEDYVADGGDPDQYVGKQAYADRYENIQENKRLRKDVKGLQTTVQQTMDTVNEWQDRERERIRTELEGELHEAKENEDPNAALAAQKKIDDLDESEPAPEAQPEHNVIQEFREANPMLDGESDDYDEEFNADVEAIYNGMYQQLSYGGRKQLTDGQIKRALKRAMKEAEELHEMQPPDDDTGKPGESPRNSRQRGNQRNNRRARQQQAKPRAEDFKIDNPRNPRQIDAATEVRDMIKEKYGDEAAENFEANLAR